MSVLDRDARSLTKNAQEAPMLGIAIPCRKRSPVEFWLSVFQLLNPLNVKIGYMIEKADEAHVIDGKLPAAARNSLLERALQRDMKFIFFLDDDVLFPDITLYRMWVQMQKNPQIACTTAVGGTKLTPSEPLIYQEGVQGAWWDWHLGAQVPIESGWAGCMLVNLDYVRKMKEPWFNDVVTSTEGPDDEKVKMNIWGHDRYFHRKLKTEAGGMVVADTGLLVAHFDADLQKSYILPPESPPFQKDILGETWIPFHGEGGQIFWRRIYIPDGPDRTFKTYLDWLQEKNPIQAPTIAMLPEETRPAPKVEQREGFTVTDNRKGDFSEWLKMVGSE